MKRGLGSRGTVGAEPPAGGRGSPEGQALHLPRSSLSLSEITQMTCVSSLKAHTSPVRQLLTHFTDERSKSHSG